VNFPKLQSLTEAKKKAKPADDMEMSFDMDLDDEGKSVGDMEDAPKGKKAKGDAPAVDKAAVLAFLKDCDPECRAAVKKKLDKMVEADAEVIKEALDVMDATLKHLGAADLDALLDKMHGDEDVKKKLLNFLISTAQKEAADGHVIFEVMQTSRKIAAAYFEKFGERIGLGAVAAKMRMAAD